MSVKKIEDIVQDIIGKLPEGLQQLPDGMRDKLKDHLQSSLRRADLVTREEFEVQKAVLLRTREKIEALEQKLENLENADSK